MLLAELLSLSLQFSNYSSNLLIAATVPPMMYLIQKEKKSGFMQRLLLTWAMKKMKKTGRKGNFNLGSLFAILSLLCLVLFFVFASGGAASGLAVPMAIGFIVFVFAWAFTAKKNR